MTDEEWSKIVKLIDSDQLILALQLGLGFGMSKIEVVRKYWSNNESDILKISGNEIWDFGNNSITIYTKDNKIISRYYNNFNHDEIVDEYLSKLINLIENESEN